MMPKGPEFTSGIPDSDEGVRENNAELPILKSAGEIKEAVNNNPTAIIVGETGSGKTTQIPLILLETLGSGEKVAITQPRRLAASSVARYVAEKAGSRVGDDIGYQVRFDDHTTEGTRINFMTDGILLRQMQNDPLLQRYSAVMVDEAHERSLNIDFILGLIKRTQAKRKESGSPPLKIIVTSATLEKEKFAKYFGDSPVVEVPGRLFPVDVHYEEREVYDYTVAAAEKVEKIVKGGKEGDILVFMPGQEEIDKTGREIQKLAVPGIIILPLYGQMSPEDQDKIFKKTPERKVIISTNIAETSVTVPGVKHVIDSGLIKQIEFNHETGIEELAAKPHAKSGCVQRTGRAGRVAAGECHRLYTKENFESRQEFQKPEIQRSDLAHVVLTMKKMGIEDVKSFEFIDAPEKGALDQAINALKTLGALDAEENLTEIGKTMAELPLDPHIARMVIEAEKHGCVDQVCTIAAFLGGKSAFNRPKEKEEEADKAHARFKVRDSDFLTLLKVWEEYGANDYRDSWARDNFINGRVMNEVRQIRYQLLRALKRSRTAASASADPDAIGKSIVSGLIGDLMVEGGRYSYTRVKDGARNFFIHPSSGLFEAKPGIFVPAEIVRTTKAWARMNQAVKPEWLKEIAPQMIRERIGTARYNNLKGRITQEVDLYIGSLLVSRESRVVEGKDAAKLFMRNLAQGEIDLPFVWHNSRVVGKINELWLRSGGKYGASDNSIKEKLEKFYLDKFGEICSKEQLERIIADGKVNPELDINSFMPEEERAKIFAANPETIEIMGKPYKVIYAHEINYDGTSRMNPTISMSVADAVKLREMPILPSGRNVTVNVLKEGHWGMAVEFSAEDIKSLKKRLRESLIKDQWDTWRRSPAAVMSINVYELRQSPELLNPKQFGTDPEDGGPLFAYPGIISEYRNEYTIEFFRSKEEADATNRGRLKMIEEMKTAKLAEIKRKELVVSATEYFGKVSGLIMDEKLNEIAGIENERNELRRVQGLLTAYPEDAMKALEKLETDAYLKLAKAKAQKEGVPSSIKELKYETRNTGGGGYDDAFIFSKVNQKEIKPTGFSSSKTGNHGSKTWSLLPGEYYEIRGSFSNSGNGGWQFGVWSISEDGQSSLRDINTSELPQWLGPLLPERCREWVKANNSLGKQNKPSEVTPGEGASAEDLIRALQEKFKR